MKNEKRVYPLSSSELGVFLDNSESTAYNLPVFLGLWPDVDIDKLKDSIQKLFDIHPHAFMRICVDENGNIGKYIEKFPFDIPVLEADSLDVYQAVPFKITDAPLFRVAIYLIKGKTYLFIEFHHIVMDGTAIDLLIRELIALYGGEEVPAEICSAEEYSVQEQAARGSDEYLAGRAYYQKTFGGIECSSVLPFDKKEEAAFYRRYCAPVSIRNSDVHTFVKENNIKTSSFFISAYSFLLAKMNMEKEALVFTIHNGRNADIRESFGMFVKTFPFYAQYTSDTRVDEYLSSNNDQMIQSVAHDLYPLVDITRDLGLSVEMYFAYQGDMGLPEKDGERLDMVRPEVPDGMGNLSFQVFRDGDGFYCMVDYRADLYEEETVCHLVQLFDRTAAEFLQKETLAEIDLLDEKEKEALDSFNTFDESLMSIQWTVIDRFYDQLSRIPDKVLVEYEDKRYTYAEVDALSNKIANKLNSFGIGKGDVVSVLIPKCEYTVIASIGILKALSAYQPLDPSYPSDRLHFMMKDADVKAVILDRSLEHIIDGYDGKRIYLDEIPSFEDSTRPVNRPDPEDLFVLLYTSGTTGLPKGVIIDHRNVATMCALYNKDFDVDESIRSTSYASYGFDAHMIDLYPSITSGGTVCVIPEKMRLDLVALGEYFNAAGITHTSITTQVGRQFLEEVELKTLKHFLVGGEKLVPVVPPKGFAFHNAYGPTEGTVFCSYQPVQEFYHRVPIGKKLDDYKAYIVDENMRRQPWGVKGELCIAGPQVARGYLNRDADNKKAFVVNPFDDSPYFSRMYKTGDIVRILKDGALDFIGRNDGQVKIRGFRVELTEVEQIIRQYPGIKDATVKDFTDPSGIKFIVAYIVSDEPIDVENLNSFIRQNKPPYMVPAFTMQIDKIPLNQNQKVNKRALPMPEMKIDEIIPPSGEAEVKMYDILSAILGHKSFGVTTDLYAAGLSSVTAIKFTVQLSKAFGKKLRTTDVAEHPTIRSLSKYMAGTEEENKREILSEYPLTKVQEGIFVECTSMAGTTVYNIPLLLKLDRSVDTARLEESIRSVVNAHPYLKMRIAVKENGDVAAKRDDNAMVKIDHAEKSQIPEGFSGLVRPFDLIKDELYRIRIISDGADKYLFVDFHHIIFDGESLVVFLRELNDAYQGNLPSNEQYTGFEYALDDAELAGGEAYKKAKSYYEGLLESVDTECLPIRDRDDESQNVGEFTIDTAIDKDALAGFLKESGSTVNALWNCAFGHALSMFLARENCVYTTVFNGRTDARLMDSVGMFVHTIPVVYSQSEAEQGRDAARRMAKQLNDSMANSVYPFSEISRNLDVKANILFVYEGSIGTDIVVGGKDAENIRLESNALKADLSVFIYETETGFRVECIYNARYYEDWSLRSLIDSTIAALKGIMRNEILGRMSLVSPEEQAKTDSMSFIERDVEKTDIVSLFRRSAAKYPDRTAVIYRETKISYRELDRITDNLAAYIQSFGIGKEDVVSILVPRGEYMVISALGALKSGAAYEPLDPSYPTERLNFMVANAKAKLVIADRSLAGLLTDYHGNCLFIDDIHNLPDAVPADPAHTGSDLFIVLYTSGTTGTPKGVMLEHRNLVNFCFWYQKFYSLVPESVAGAYASFGFDANMMDQYPALTCGAAVYIIPEDLRLDLKALDQSFVENKVSHIFMTTQMGRMFAENMKGSSLKHLSVGGETLASVNPPEGYSLWNGYGPTECTIFSTIRKIDRFYYRNPIGNALDNYKLYVVGKNGCQMPIGALGELWIAGAGVGRGYLDLPEQTKKAFLDNPFESTAGFERVYRTGDIVRRLPDYGIDFIGRNDGQVKIRGFRIELSEVESVIREYPGIKNVTVQAFEDKSFGGKFLAAYVTSDRKVDFSDLADFIKSKKPPYMVPAAFMQLDEIPLNQNQKVNKRALPVPQRSSAETRPLDAPSTPLEREICSVFASILGMESVGATDDFFEMGGTSISAAKIVMFAVNKNYPVVYKDVFDNPTARALAHHIETAASASANPVEAVTETEQRDALKNNISRYVDEIKEERPLGKTLLVGPTGFLGSHVLKELLNNKTEIIALCRSSNELDAATRLSALMAYYFDSPLTEEIEEYVTVIDGDITNSDLETKLKGERIDTIINCAASVKHFSNDDSIERINLGGVLNLIEVAKQHHARLIQISTLSVAGENIDGKFPPSFRMTEDMLYFGQDISNKYVNSKFKAEQAVFDAIEGGLDCKVIRVGNLMGRQSDGEFQINSITNSFIKSLRAYNALGYFPVSACDATVDFSPIDEVAKAVVRLSRTNAKFTVFHVANSHELQMGDVIEAMNRNGFPIRIVRDEVFAEKLSEMMRDDTRSMLASSLLTYSSSDHHVHTFIKSDNTFTIKALYRIGFRWPVTDEAYLTRVIEGLKSLEYFDKFDI